MTAQNKCMELLRLIHLPHYVQYSTRTQTLCILRRMLRAVRKIPVPMVSEHLSHMTVHAFHAYKCTTDSHKIQALHKIALGDLATLESGVYKRNYRDLSHVLERSLRSWGVKNSPFLRIMKPSVQSGTQQARCDLQDALKNANVTLPRTMAYRLNNLRTPRPKSIEEHTRLKNENQLDYYRFVRFLAKNDIKKGKSNRKLFTEPALAYTPLGNPAALCRQKNHVKRVYAQVLRDSYRPVAPQVIELVNAVIKDMHLPRVYRRRFEEFGEKLYSLDENMQRIRSNLYRD